MTACDEACEQQIISTIKQVVASHLPVAICDTSMQRFPSHSVIAEEGFQASPFTKMSFNSIGMMTARFQGELDDDSPTWIIDPIDGTRNFVHGSPHVSVSIAMALKRQAIGELRASCHMPSMLPQHTVARMTQCRMFPLCRVLILI